MESLRFRLCRAVHDAVEVPLESGGAVGFCRLKASIPHWARAASVAADCGEEEASSYEACFLGPSLYKGVLRVSEVY